MTVRTIALAIQKAGNDVLLADSFSDETEIAVLEASLTTGKTNPLSEVYTFRENRQQADEEFAEYLENILSQGAVVREVRDKAVQWYYSKIRIEKIQSDEQNARALIANYAYELFLAKPNNTDFLLCGPVAKVRVRIFLVEGAEFSSKLSAS